MQQFTRFSSVVFFRFAWEFLFFFLFLWVYVLIYCAQHPFSQCFVLVMLQLCVCVCHLCVRATVPFGLSALFGVSMYFLRFCFLFCFASSLGVWISYMLFVFSFQFLLHVLYVTRTIIESSAYAQLFVRFYSIVSIKYQHQEFKEKLTAYLLKEDS